MQSFKGQISKVKKEVLTHTSGEIKSTEIKTKYSLFFDKQIISGGGGGGKVQTTHEHYTNFKIDKVFSLWRRLQLWRWGRGDDLRKPNKSRLLRVDFA